MTAPYFVTAIGTPLTEKEELHETGLEAHLRDQWDAGISGLLVAGTMGAMQLLSDATYRRLVEVSVRQSTGRGQVFIGAGDVSFIRTRDRIEFLNQHKIDGVVVLAPYLLTFSPEELLEYYTSLADMSRAPLYLYDLPMLTKTKLRIDTILALSKHPNIHGIKCSDDASFIRQLIDTVDESFRVFVAQPDLVDVLLRWGMHHHLDGVYALAPGWTVAIGEHGHAGRWDEAARFQTKMSTLRRLLIQHGVFPTFTVLMNARGIAGSFAPRPCKRLSEAEKQVVLGAPIVKELLAECPLARKPASVRA